MKKVAIAFGVAFSALISNAAYLYWQVDASDYGESFDRAVVKYYNPSSGNIDDGANGTFGTYYSLTDYDPSTEEASTSFSEYGTKGTMYSIDLSTLANANQYSYYIELQNSSGGFVARTAESSAMTYAALESAGAIFDASIVAVPSVTPWHGASYTPVPEPTSAILMLFGAAFLGLKRKNRSIV